MNKKTIYIIVAVLVVIIVVAAAAIALTYKAPAKTVTVSVAKATSLQFAVNATSAGTTTTLNFAGENIGTSNLIVRIDYPAYNMSFILNYGTQKASSSLNSGTTWTSDVWATDLSSWGARRTGEVTALGNWNGKGTTYTYTSTSAGVTSSITIYNISVNPKLAASLFQTS